MAIHFACASCNSKYTVKDRHAGKESICKVCGHQVQVPPVRPSRATPNRVPPPFSGKVTPESKKVPPPTPIDSTLPHGARNFRTPLIAIGAAIMLIIPVPIFLVVRNKPASPNTDEKVGGQPVSSNKTSPQQARVTDEPVTPRPKVDSVPGANEKEGERPGTPAKKGDPKQPDKEVAKGKDADPIKANIDRAIAIHEAEKREYRKKVGEHFDKSIAEARAFANELGFTAEVAAFHKAVGEYFDKREDDARKDGDKKLVDQIKQDRKNFADDGELPDTLPAEIKNMKQAVLLSKQRVSEGKSRVGRLNAERKAFGETGELPSHIPKGIVLMAQDGLAKLRAAYELAIKDYTKARKDDEATWAEKEQEKAEREWKKFQAFFKRIDNEAAIAKSQSDSASAVDAIANGLEWLARKQLKDGSWAFDGSSKDKIAATGMALLPFLGDGEWLKPEGKYKKTVENGLDWLRKQIGDGGGFNGSNNMYSHAIATLALCEATRMTKDPALKAKSALVVSYIVGAQGRNGSWGYSGPGSSEGDTSIVGWQIQALNTAIKAEILFDKGKVFTNANKFLESVSTDSGSKYGYTTKGASQTLTPVGLLSRYAMGMIDPMGEAYGRGVDFIKQFPPHKGYFDMYYYYYATRAVVLRGGEGWRKFWEPKMRVMLIDLQNKGGNDEKRGSWEKDQGFIGSRNTSVG